MLNRAILLVENVIDTTLLPLVFPVPASPSWKKKKNNAGFLASSESERIMGAVLCHSGSVCECLQLDVLLSRR